jgi:hypothetical protein
MPGLGGMPDLGGGGLGMPAGGLSPVGGSGLGPPPAVGAVGGDKDPLKPADLTTHSEALKPPPVTGPAGPDAPPTEAPTGARPAPSPAPQNPPPPGPEPEQPTAATTDGKDITLPSGQVVTARSPQGATAVRNALAHPSETGDVATAAYEGTGVGIPTDGADPGRKVDPTDVKPGDIVVFADHTAIVAGNGQLIGPDGQLQPLGAINDMPGFKGFFDPTATSDATAGAPNPTPPPGDDTATADSGTKILAGPTPRSPATAGNPPDDNPGFGLPQRPHHDS